ncbi:MAG: hypothetical protein KGZ85_10345 [Ignavibacterium sp.]|nr:hypothetical protein [Ignavibacterium sp.]
MNEGNTNNRRLIKDVDTVQRFRDILFYQRQISNSTIFLLLILYIFLPRIWPGITSIMMTIIFIALAIIPVAAILFTPYIFYVLIKEKRFGWIAIFFAMIIIPLLLAHILFKGEFVYEGLMLIPLASFYFYCYLIKFEVDKWLNEYYSFQELLQQKKESEEKKFKELW